MTIPGKGKKLRTNEVGASPSKQLLVRDPIHGFVRLDRFDFIREIVSLKEFQRLHHISQLGVSRFVYPSATHTRFSHSLGAMHVMGRILDNLALVGDVNRDELEDLTRVGLAAALLHDIGHGPLSHSSEGFFGFKHEKITIELITRPPISDILDRAGVDPKRIVGIIRRTSVGSDLLLSQLISSELDVDRLDYLARDSYFSGVGFGNVDVERIVNLLRVFKGTGPLDNHAISPLKGMHSIESYILGRHLMYQAVYFHKATRGVEKIVGNAFRRVKERASQISLPDNLGFLDGQMMPTAEEILEMDDHTVFDALRRWQRSKDTVLRELCRRLFQRRLLKAIEMGGKELSAYMTGIDAKVRVVARKHRINPDYFCPIDGPSDTPYSVYSIKSPDDESTVTTNIFLYGEDQKPVEISQTSDVVKSLAKTEYRNRLYVPEEIRADVRHLFARK